MKLRKDLSAREVEELHQALMRRLGDSSVPTLPEVAVKVIRLVSDPNSSLKQFVDVVQTDQALTGRLLRTANSALFAQRQPVTQLQRAMVLLGLDRLKAMALGFHLSQAAANDQGDFSVKRIWSQSLFRAWTAFRLTEYFDRTITGEAFIVGLMQDAALPMMPKLVGAPWGQVVNAADIPQRRFFAETQGLEFTHVDVIASLLKMWKLPDTLAKPILSHHTSPDIMNPKSQASILHCVAYYVGTMHLDTGDGEGPRNPAAATAKRLFGLEPAGLQKTLKNAAADFRSSKELFAHIVDENTSLEEILSNASAELQDTRAMQAITAGEKAPTLRFENNGLILEMEAAGPKRVTVFIADSSGARLLSESVDPSNKSSDDLRKMLLLDTAPPELVENVVNEMRKLAA